MTDTEETIDIAELTSRLGLPAHEQGTVLAWTNELPERLWTEAEVEELIGIWQADIQPVRNALERD